MLNAQLAELEQDFRKNWHGYRPQAYEGYLRQAAPEEQAALLARLLSVELEYAFQPPDFADPGDQDVGDDERVKPRVSLFLHRFPQLQRQRELLIQLVMLEFALRLRFDSTPPNYESYLDLCPHEKERVVGMMQMMEEKLYRAGTTGEEPESQNNDTTVAEGTAPKTISLAHLPCSLGYFLLTHVIGQGGMGRVYNAVDLRSAAHVAVKVIHRTDSWSVYRFIEEFTWLSTLNHPNVVKLYDTFREGDVRYFSMELVEGQAIHNWFKRLRGEERWSKLRRVLSQAALAVAFLHDHDVVHRDIKSSNLMITGRGRAVLLDLGLANRADDEPGSTQLLDGQRLVGTLHYLAPEVLTGGPTSFASDWFSFGVMMFETITGDFPNVKVDAPTPEGIGQRYALDMAAARERLGDCPEDLASLCLEMLSSSPVLRPAAADIVRRLGSDVGQPIPFSVRDTDFAGREEGLAFLEQARATIRQGAPALRLIRGDSGMGKTAMLNRWARQCLNDSSTMWLAVRCHSQDHTPLRALNLLVQELVTSLSRTSPEFWQDLLRGGGEEIVYTFPQMERLTGGAWPALSSTADSMEGVARRAAGLHALLTWLKGLSRRVNLVMTIDDAHWADKESGRILSHLMRSGDEFQGLIIVVDQGAQVPSPLLQGLSENWQAAVDGRHIYEMPPLARGECTWLLDRWCKRAGIALRREVAGDILERSKGSPFLLQELLRSYMNYIVRHRLSDDTWLSGTEKEAGVLHNRFSMLPPTTEKVLQFVAASPQPLGIHQLQTASRILPAALLAELNHLSGQGWIRLNGTTLDSEVEISHERFREVVIQSMLEERLQRRHYRLARMLSSEVPPPWRRIAHHYSEARQFREAAACYMEGARAAARRLAYAEALWMLERAFHPLAQRTEKENRSAGRLRADCLAGLGNATAAAQAYEALAADQGDEALLMRCLAGEQWIRAGRLEPGLMNLRPLFDQLGGLRGETGLRNRVRRGLSMLQLMRASPSAGFLRDAECFSEIEQCLNRITGPLAFLDASLGGSLIARMFALALQKGTSFDRAIAFMRWALVLQYLGPRALKQATRWIRLARLLAARSGSPNARALSHVCLFLWHSLQGHFNTSLRYAQRAERLYDNEYASDTWETGLVRWISLHHLWYLGRLKELCAKTLLYRQDAAQRIDTMWMYWMHVNGAHLADLIGDQVEEGRRSLATAEALLTDRAFETPQILLLLSHVRQSLYEGNAREAHRRLLDSWPAMKSSQFMSVTYYEWLVLYLRIVCDLVCIRDDPSRRTDYLRDARRQLKRLLKMKPRTFLVYAQALELAVEAAAGHVPAAERWHQVLQAARRHRLDLLVLAVQWHAAFWHPAGDGNAARQRLLDEGCANPERLMNIILPLPHA